MKTYRGKRWTVYHMDILDYLEEFRWMIQNADGLFHACFDDPPYNLDSIRKRFGKPNAAPAKGGVYHRSSKGFMGLGWDTDIAFNPRLWDLTRRVLHPAAFAISFSGTRTYHKMTAAADVAGFEVMDQLLYVYGSSMPKGQNLTKDADRVMGKKPTAIGRKIDISSGKEMSIKQSQMGAPQGTIHPGWDRPWKHDETKAERHATATIPTSDLAKTLEGYYGSTALKPAHEPLAVLQNPLKNYTSEEMHRQTGWDHWGSTKELDETQAFRTCSAVNTKLSELEVFQIRRKALHKGATNDLSIQVGTMTPIVLKTSPYKPWKIGSILANTVMTGAGAINVDERRIEREGIKSTVAPGWKSFSQINVLHNYRPRDYYEDQDGVEYNPHEKGGYPANLALQHTELCIPLKEGEWQCIDDCAIHQLDLQAGIKSSGTGAVKKASAAGYKPRAYGSESRPKGTPNVEYGDSGYVSRYFNQLGWQYEIAERLLDAPTPRYITKPTKTEKDAGLTGPDKTMQRLNPGGLSNEPRWAPVPRKNDHATVKSIDFAKHICTLLLPPDLGFKRRILVRFGGSGSEAIGALLAGWDEVVVVELEQRSIDILVPRLMWWEEQIDNGLSEVDKILGFWTEQQKKKEEQKEIEQMRMF